MNKNVYGYIRVTDYENRNISKEIILVDIENLTNLQYNLKYTTGGIFKDVAEGKIPYDKRTRTKV